MQKTIIKYGLSGLFTAAILFLLVILLSSDLSYSAQEILGYATMLAALSFIFFSIKHYRDKENHGIVGFGKALLIGILISTLVGLGIAIADYIYTTIINPDFAEDFLVKSLQTLEASYSGSELETKKAELTQQMKDYGGSGFMAFMMFATVFILGFIISLISAFILQRKN